MTSSLPSMATTAGLWICSRYEAGIIITGMMTDSRNKVKSAPAVTVGVPVYNCDPYVGDCIRSVLGQFETDWELILVDDGSSDDSGAICAEMAASDSRIRVITQQNRGLSAARNVILDAARGEYVTFLDSDDLLHPYFLWALLSLVRLYGADIAGCRMRRFADGSADLASLGGIKLPPFRSWVAGGEEAYSSMLYQTFPIDTSACGKLFRRSLWREERFAEGMWYEDLEASARVFPDAGKIAVTDMPLYFYRQRKGSIVHTSSNRRTDALRATESIQRLMERKHPQLAAAARDRRLSAAFNILGLMAAGHFSDSEARKMCEEVVRGYRRESLLGRHTRLKNRVAIILTYLGGLPLYKFVAAFLYR